MSKVARLRIASAAAAVVVAFAVLAKAPVPPPRQACEGKPARPYHCPVGNGTRTHNATCVHERGGGRKGDRKGGGFGRDFGNSQTTNK